MNRLTLPALGLLFLASAGSAAAQDFSCPAQLEAGASSAPGETIKFRYVSFFDGDPSKMVDLAPDDGANPKLLEQSWQFAQAPGSPVTMVCRYHGTEETVNREVPADIKGCRLEGIMDGKGEILGSPTLKCD